MQQMKLRRAIERVARRHKVSFRMDFAMFDAIAAAVVVVMKSSVPARAFMSGSTVETTTAFAPSL
jgi:hypothetical protein